MTIDDIIANVLIAEGGYVNDVRDAGGETNFGITKATAVSQGYTGAMRDMPRAFAIEVYRRQYVIAPGFDKIFPTTIAAKLVDIGVNMGVTVPGRFLQRALNALNQGGKDYADLLIDGNVGQKSRDALAALLAKRGKDGERVVLELLRDQQGVRYLDLSDARATNEAFTFGWILNRVCAS